MSVVPPSNFGPLFGGEDKPQAPQLNSSVAKDDQTRLGDQYLTVEKVMRDGKWRTLSEIALDCHFADGKHYPEASVSARLRDMRNLHGWTIARRARNAKRGLIEYHAEKAGVTQ